MHGSVQLEERWMQASGELGVRAIRALSWHRMLQAQLFQLAA